MNNKAVLLILGIIAGTAAMSNASQITLDPGSLPSDQGWDYSATGLHAGTVETDIFSTDGSTLNMDSMDQPYGSTGGNIIYTQSSVIGSAMPTVLEWTSRTLEYEYVPSYGQNQGFRVFFSDGSLTYSAGISLTQVALLDGADFKYVAVDATEYHTYRIETVTGTSAYKLYIDNVLQASASAYSAPRANALSFGDSTGGANSRTDITTLEFSQIPEPASMSIVLLSTGGFIFIRRLFGV